MDSFGRHIDYLRISVTDRCDGRCLYCAPAPGCHCSEDQLRAEELVRVVRVAVSLGFRKFRLTGGEPLLREDLVDIVRAMSATPGLRHIGISTNGTRLAPLARRLRHAGAATVNISLDALDPAVYRRITGADVEAVLAGIRAAAVAQFARVKLNCVLLRGINEQELWPLVGFAAKHDLPVRFIELMPVTANDALIERSFLPISEAMRLIAERDELIPQHGDPLGWGPTRYYRLKRTGVLVGFIGALTTPRFCETCNKLRLTADGKLRPCLGDNGEYDLRQVLRCGADDEALRARFSEALRAKPRAHSFCREYLPNRPMTAIGG